MSGVSVGESGLVTVGESVSASGSGGADSTGADSTGVDSGDTGDTGDSDSGDSDTGEEVEPGQTAVGFVNAGTVSTSPGYRMIWTFGQETQNQNTMDSAGHTLRGGLINASQ